MKKSRFLSLSLTLALTLSMMSPALAAEEAPIDGVYTVNGAEVPVIPAGADPMDYFTIHVSDLTEAGVDPTLLDVSLDAGQTEETFMAPEEEWDGWEAWENWEDDPLTLYVNGRYAASEEDGGLFAVGGVTYADAATLNAVLGTHYAQADGPLSLRAAAEAAGWDVVWNARNNEIVLLDRKILGAVELSQAEQFIRRLLDLARTEPGKCYQTTETCDVAFTVLNSLDGNKTCTARVTAELLQRDLVYDLTLTVSAAELLNVLSPQAREQLLAQTPKLKLRDLKTLLGGIRFNAIVDLEKGMLAWNLPVLAMLDPSVSADAWTVVDLGGEWDGLTSNLPAEEDGMERWVEDALYATLLSRCESSWQGVEDACEDFTRTVTLLDCFLGPQAFTEKNGTVTWALDAEDLATAAERLDAYDGGWDVAGLFKEYTVSLSLTANGRLTGSAALRLDTDAMGAMLADDGWGETTVGETVLYQWLLGLLDVRLSAESSTDAAGGESLVRFQWKNQFDLEISTVSTRKPTTRQPRTAPPEGTELLEW